MTDNVVPLSKLSSFADTKEASQLVRVTTQTMTGGSGISNDRGILCSHLIDSPRLDKAKKPLVLAFLRSWLAIWQENIMSDNQRE
jgi:hypothetical protein